MKEKAQEEYEVGHVVLSKEEEKTRLQVSRREYAGAIERTRAKLTGISLLSAENAGLLGAVVVGAA